ncbi:MAG: MBOAT family protein [Clostridia bacterium]|nr:MBOAT family protein [Clostridia bacterium]
MLFCSEIFLFLFLPAVILLYYLFKPLGIRVRNTILLVASILFYGWGEPRFVFVMLVSIILNYVFGLLMYRMENQLTKKLFLSASVVVNLSLLFVYKYLDFSITNVNALFGTMIPLRNIALPIGISFFTFQAMSYVIDVYRGKEQVQKNLFDLVLYVSFFPQLIAGPIVRYETVAAQIRERTETLEMFTYGIKRFIVGLGKKVMLANTLALVSDMAFDMNPELLSTSMAWIGIVAYTLMIYFDFSGYSDMAIGLGKMFGFTFEENFNYPYISKSITEFWRRWHISMQTWFRDYLYFPLGGSRSKTVAKRVFNLFVVWLATGIWHGANWTFIVWGMFYFVLQFFEKYFKPFNKIPGWIRYIYTMLFVMLGWVLFRSTTISGAIEYMGRMFTPNFTGDGLALMNIREHGLGILAGLVCMTPLGVKLNEKVRIPWFISTVAYFAIFVLSVLYIVKGGYNVFIYFNF